MVICSKKKSKLRRPPKICTIFPLPASFVWNTLLHYVAKPISIHPEDVRLKSFPKKSFPTCPLSFQRVDPVIHPNKTIPPLHTHTPTKSINSIIEVIELIILKYFFQEECGNRSGFPLYCIHRPQGLTHIRVLHKYLLYE